MFNVRDYGALGSGSDETAALQAAIDTCHAAGGGRVLLPGGATDRTNTLTRKANVDLHLEAGAVLAAFPGYADQMPHPTALISANGADNISISGEGVIEGGGQQFVHEIE